MGFFYIILICDIRPGNKRVDGSGCDKKDGGLGLWLWIVLVLGLLFGPGLWLSII